MQVVILQLHVYHVKTVRSKLQRNAPEPIKIDHQRSSNSKA